MNDVDAYKKARFKDCIIFFILAFFSFLIGIFFLIRNGSIKSRYIKTTATISEINTYYDGDSHSGDVFVDFVSEDNVPYNNVYLNMYSDTFYVGRQIKIMYRIDNPTIIMTYLGVWLPLVISFSIFVFSSIGGTIIIFIDLKHKKKEEKKPLDPDYYTFE